MKYLLLMSLIFTTLNLFASNKCENLPREGVIEVEVSLNDGELSGLFIARLKINNNVEQYGGESVSTHTFFNPKISVNGKDIPMTSIVLNDIAKGLGYEHVEYVTMLEYKGKYVDNDYSVKKTGWFGPRVLVVDPYYSAVFYHSKCSNWRY